MGGACRKGSKQVHPNAPEFFLKVSTCLGKPILPRDTLTEQNPVCQTDARILELILKESGETTSC